MRHSKLVDVRPPSAPNQHSLVHYESHQVVGPIVRFMRLYREVLSDRDASSVERILKSQLLIPASDDRLFELWAGMVIVRSIERLGYCETRIQLLPNAAVPFSVLERGDERISVWWQRPVWSLPFAIESESTYHQALAAAGLRKSSLRPDFLVSRSDGAFVMIEVKHTTSPDESPERIGIRESLAYVDDARDLLTGMPTPHVVVCAWNASGRPSTHRISVTDQNHLERAMTLAIDTWPANPVSVP